MNLATLDWLIVAGLMATLTFAAITTKRYGNSVSGFLAANRCAGRYLISVAFNMAQLGVITLVWYFQQNYDVGFTSIWWSLMEGPALILMALSGWVIYRFRQTRAMTLAQFFERRYSKNFRVFAGLLPLAPASSITASSPESPHDSSLHSVDFPNASRCLDIKRAPF